MTRDQVQSKLESVKTRITLLEAMRDSTDKELDSADLESVKKDREDKEAALKASTEELEKSRKYCWFGEKLCNIQSKENEVSKALAASSSANLRAETLAFQFGAKSQMKDQIDHVLARLKIESESLERQLAESDPSSSSSLVDDVGTTEPLNAHEVKDNWAMFEFSSTKSSKESSSTSFDTSTTASISTWVPAASGSVSQSVGVQSFSEHVRSADVKVKAKFLKVKINRPWFRPDLFMNREFKLVSNKLYMNHPMSICI